MEQRLEGVAISDGIAIGSAVLRHEREISFNREGSNPLEEKKRIRGALEAGRRRLSCMLEDELTADARAIIEAHRMFLEDESLQSEMVEDVLARGSSAPEAVDSVLRSTKDIFLRMDSEVFRERAQDMEDIRALLLEILCFQDIQAPLSVGEDSILFGRDFLPSETASFQKNPIRGMVLAEGSTASHSAIIARSLGIPGVARIGMDVMSSVREGMPVIVDGMSGLVILEPNESTLHHYRERIGTLECDRIALRAYRNGPTSLSDGARIELHANIASDVDVDNAKAFGAEGIGLLRSEFLFLDRALPPNEEEQMQFYHKVLKSMRPRTVIVRTLDIGGDKRVPFMDPGEEENPFLGCRGVRLCRRHPEIFEVQLRALLRANRWGNLKIMIPMVSGVEEVIAVKEMLASIRSALEADAGVSLAKYGLGIMVETPSAALMADRLADEVDFFSIGTNDLTQYTLAVDRMNTEVADLYRTEHPAVLSLIQSVTTAAKRAGIQVGMCGYAAADPRLCPLWVGMGLDELSMVPAKIPEMRRYLSMLSSVDAEELVDEVLRFDDPNHILSILQEFTAKDGTV